MKRLSVLLLLLISLPVTGAQVVVECAEVSSSADATRLILRSEQALPHQVFTLDGPDRVVIDIPHAKLTGRLPAPRATDPTLVGLRSGLRGEDDLRIVVDLKHPVRVKSFRAPDPETRGYRLVLDLLSGDDRADGPSSVSRRVASTSGPGQPAYRKAQVRAAVIAIDAGHGGEDPGAIGPSGTREKDVTLAIARKLERLIRREPGMRAVMIRDSDVFIPLRERSRSARQHGADLFVSIHADAFESPEAVGSSVYTISQGGASSEAAEWLASRENDVDRIGGVDVSAEGDVLGMVLLDMSWNATIEHSTKAAGSVLQQLSKLGPVHKADVQHAGFVVLKSPDVPSVLVETAFISNSAEEQRLNSSEHQERLARAILAGIKAHFQKYPPQGLRSADAGGDRVQVAEKGADPRPTAQGPSREHVISQGDTLSGIAKRYSVSLSSLRAENGLGSDDEIRAGQVLSIPAGS